MQKFLFSLCVLFVSSTKVRWRECELRKEHLTSFDEVNSNDLEETKIDEVTDELSGTSKQ